jgi:hypothetical protein
MCSRGLGGSVPLLPSQSAPTRVDSRALFGIARVLVTVSALELRRQGWPSALCPAYLAIRRRATTPPRPRTSCVILIATLAVASSALAMCG